VAEPLEAFVVEAVFAALDSPEFARARRSTSKQTGTEERELVAGLEQDRAARGQLTTTTMTAFLTEPTSSRPRSDWTIASRQVSGDWPSFRNARS
jgi:hypothetical protein